MSNVEILRQAAQLMRNIAESATGGPWTTSLVWSPDSTATSGIYSNAHPAGSGASEVVASGQRTARGFGGIRDPRNARHIASWQPPVALAVAAWLEEAAGHLEQHIPAWTAPSRGVDDPPALAWDNPERLAALVEHHYGPALAVARAYIEAAAR